jgi:hypothetical protein
VLVALPSALTSKKGFKMSSSDPMNNMKKVLSDFSVGRFDELGLPSTPFDPNSLRLMVSCELAEQFPKRGLSATESLHMFVDQSQLRRLVDLLTTELQKMEEETAEILTSQKGQS